MDRMRILQFSLLLTGLPGTFGLPHARGHNDHVPVLNAYENLPKHAPRLTIRSHVEDTIRARVAHLTLEQKARQLDLWQGNQDLRLPK